MFLLLSRRNGILLSAIFSALLVVFSTWTYQQQSLFYAFLSYVCFGLTLVFGLRATRFMYTIEMLQGDKKQLLIHMLYMVLKLVLLPGLTTYLWFGHQRLLQEMLDINQRASEEHKLPLEDMHVAPTSLIKTYLAIIKTENASKPGNS